MPPNPHPLIVHFTIALFTLSIIFDLVGSQRKSRSLRNAGKWNLYIAFIAAIVTVVTGLWAEGSVGYPEEPREILEGHQLIGFVVLSIIALLSLLRFLLKDNMTGMVFAIYIITGLVGIGFLAAGAYYGGELVYKFGVGVELVP